MTQPPVLSKIRTALEVLARGRMLRRRLPNGLPIYVSPDSQLKYLARSFDADLLRLVDEFVDRESVVWDIGANCGVFAFASAHARHVMAVEADPFLCHVIQESMALNGVDLSLVCAAAAAEAGIGEFSIAKRGRASNHLSAVAGRSQTGGIRSRILVPTLPLDRLLELGPAPTFIKIDVEGAEVAVLQGARRVLSEIRPVISLETVDETHAACRAILEGAGYTLREIDPINWVCLPG